MNIENVSTVKGPIDPKQVTVKNDDYHLIGAGHSKNKSISRNALFNNFYKSGVMFYFLSY